MTRFSDRARFERDHRWAPENMSDYLDGELAASLRGRIERHLGECQECRRLLAGLRAVVDGLRRLPAPGGGVEAVQIAASVRVRLNEPRRGD
ncbi:MAG TPA: zf-HC2 domain-containing protein [Acidimicrobiales bacterium]|nr:zf-HC2 domain-containing protein [Acidimicrobiales bacterium]